MEKIYVRFGDFSKNDKYISCFEGIIEDNIVKVIIPTILYSTCQLMARNIDEQAYLVDGTIIGKGNAGEPLMANVRIKIPLTYNKTLETYISEESHPHIRKKAEKSPKWRR